MSLVKQVTIEGINMNGVPVLFSLEIPHTEIRNRQLILLTKCKIAVFGIWAGHHGEHFIGWADPRLYGD